MIAPPATAAVVAAIPISAIIIRPPQPRSHKWFQA